jgi:hypothetical protein
MEHGIRRERKAGKRGLRAQSMKGGGNCLQVIGKSLLCVYVFRVYRCLMRVIRDIVTEQPAALYAGH